MCLNETTATDLQITIVARVVSLKENSTNLDLQVDDSTGKWDVKLYVDPDEYTSVSTALFFP